VAEGIFVVASSKRWRQWLPGGIVPVFVSVRSGEAVIRIAFGEETVVEEKDFSKARRDAVVYACLAVHGMLAFGNGIMLSYLRGIGVPEARLILYLTLPIFFLAVLRVPVAILADEFGKKRLGRWGIAVGTAGFAAIAAASFLGGSTFAEPTAVAGIVVFSFGMTLTGSGWFALLEPIVPKRRRGLFFGRIRLSWQLSGVVFSGLATWILSHFSGETGFQILFVLVIVLLTARWFFYAKIPEIDEPESRSGGEKSGLGELLGYVLKSPGVAPFSAYLFALMFFVAYSGRVFSLMEKQVLGLSNGDVVWLANLTMIGNLAGFVIGGKAVDRFGTRPVFIGCQLALPAVLAVYVTRGLGDGHLAASLWTAHILLGVVMAAASIALTTEMLALTPKRRKSTATSLMMSFQMAGSALAGMACAGVVKAGALPRRWSFEGMDLNHYDAILMISAAMSIVLLVAAATLVPSVLGKHAWIPGEELAE